MSTVLAETGASLCCVAPLGGAWVTTLTAFEPVRPVFMGLALLFMGLTFHKLYLTSHTCEPGKPCADQDVIPKQRLIFWSVTIPFEVCLEWLVYIKTAQRKGWSASLK
jgi:mercuric ion transport protein